ncbi:hypothetical protein ATI61_10688 [Archangium gephyra]|uniref:Lipoprotein n=1 Tax=Archangium gephyra TaxID=48 RepID=A0AAC8TAJ9_9BACT|nr:hypothetical protein [Archangium gephyra]AKI98692.1 Hypothetical protein AA314_00319 [Archangium gephyra]REG30619.1 hypothetical protein ATI61_10688 [Archangium gephyra]
MSAAVSHRATLALLLAGVGAACRSAPSGKPEPGAGTPTALEDPHHHVVDVKGSWVTEDPNEGFALVPVPAPAAGSEWDERAVSPDGKREAFATCEPECRVLVQAVGQGAPRELRGPAFTELRPFSGLVWLAPDILVFDQWTQPHYGIHYAVDVGNGRLLQAAPFPDSVEGR